MTSGSDRDPDLRTDLDAALQTRKELGEAYEAELVDGFLEKVEQRVDATVDKRVRRQLAEQQMVIARGGRPQTPDQYRGPGSEFVLAAISLVLAIPLSAIAAANSGLNGLLTCWAGIVAVNGFYVLRRDRRHPPQN
ncbi:hypothetical protein [Streptomyces sp. RFCAC02]|uniref:hypothetical protein n=1 Tax=Streptomyces sp. RFCAC02 TaxID=2499143 RepID=UPI00102224F0|nr:hypothetical protein [Streptomyces sp. RFCAC02]